MRRIFLGLVILVMVLVASASQFACTTGKITQNKKPKQNKEARKLLAAADKNYEIYDKLQGEVESLFLEAYNFKKRPKAGNSR